MSNWEIPPFTILLLAILWAIRTFPYFKLSGVKTIWLQTAFAIKVGAGLIMFLLYTYHYPVRSEADTFKYFDDSKFLYDAIWVRPMDFFKMLSGIGCENDYFFQKYYVKMNNWYLAYDNGLLNDGRLMIRLNALFRFFSFGSYHLHNLILNLLSFLGLYSLMRLFTEISGSHWKSYVSAFLIPSVIFWSSGILKEALLIFALGLFCWNLYLSIYKPFKKRYLAILIFLTPVLLIVKLYVFIALLIAATGMFVSSKSEHKRTAFLLTILTLVSVIYFVGLIFPKYYVIDLLVQKQHDFISLSQRTGAKSYIPTEKLDNTMISVLQSIPSGCWNVLTRPWPRDIHSALFMPPLMENVALLITLFILVISRNKLFDRQLEFFYFSVTFSLILFTVIGITTPVIGAIVRYKIPALPFLILSVLMALKPLRKELVLENMIQKA